MPRASRVFVIEDDDDVRDALALALGEAGYAVDSAGNGAEALAVLARGTRPHLILLDVSMPVMDGAEFRRRQRADPHLAAIPVIVLTAGTRRDATALGVERIVVKPVALETLLSEVRRALGAAGP